MHFSSITMELPIAYTRKQFTILTKLCLVRMYASSIVDGSKANPSSSPMLNARVLFYGRAWRLASGTRLLYRVSVRHNIDPSPSPPSWISRWRGLKLFLMSDAIPPSSSPNVPISFLHAVARTSGIALGSVLDPQLLVGTPLRIVLNERDEQLPICHTARKSLVELTDR